MDRMLSPTAASGLPATPARAYVLVVLACLAGAFALTSTSNAPPSGDAAARAGGISGGASAGLPAEALGAVSATLGRSAPEYRARVARGADAARGTISTLSAPQRLRASFARRGVLVSARGASFSLSLQSLTRGSGVRALRPATPVADGNRVVYTRSGLSEWYANGPLGLEQGFTLAAPPAGSGSEVGIVMRLAGNGAARLADGGRALMLRGPDGTAIRYGGLLATDASGRRLPSRMVLGGGRLRLLIGTRGARYPLRVDPLLQQGRRLTAPGGGSELFGYSVALSEDGNTAVIGARHGDGAWVFVRTGSAWSVQSPLVTGEDEGEPACEAEASEGECGFGRAVAISADGDTAIVGAARAEEHRGAAWVFTREGSSWTQQGPEPTPSDEAGRGHFGAAVALSADGRTAVIGGPADRSHHGAAWVFAHGSAGWSQSVKLTGPGISEGTYFGRSVAISQDASTVAIGGTGDEHYAGAVWVFGDVGSTWMQRGGKLVGGGESGEGRFGYSLAMSADASTLLVGGRGDAGNAGAGWIFTRAGASGYVQQGEKLTASGELGAAQLGYSAALSRSGDVALLGGPRDDEGVGAAWVFKRTESGFSQQAKLTGADTTGKAWFGTSVALSGDARTALVGGFRDAHGAGAAWVFHDKEGASGEPPGEEPPPEPEQKGGSSETAAGTGQSSVTVIVGSGGVLGSTFVALPAPALGISGNLAPLSGKVCVKLPRSKVCVPLTGLRQVPFGTIIDARHGKVSLTTAAPGCGTQTITYYGGMLKIGQSKDGTVTATLVGGNFKLCPTARERRHLARASARRSSRRHTVRKLWSEGHGSYSTKGNYATGAVLGTRWLTEDRCNGTLIRVLTDKVLVRDLVTHRKHLVKAGRSYFAKAP
jgi:hypothetical protein